MAFKLIALVALFGLVNANPIDWAPKYITHIAYAAPIQYGWEEPKIVEIPKPKEEKKEEEPYDHNPHYSYSYDVHDSHTGDIKKAQESRKGDAVEGSYSLIEADGSRRIVHYTADDHHGFNAIVEKEPAKIIKKEEIKHEIKHILYPVTYYKLQPVAHWEKPQEKSEWKQ